MKINSLHYEVIVRYQILEENAVDLPTCCFFSCCPAVDLHSSSLLIKSDIKIQKQKFLLALAPLSTILKQTCHCQQPGQEHALTSHQLFVLIILHPGSFWSLLSPTAAFPPPILSVLLHFGHPSFLHLYDE